MPTTSLAVVGRFPPPLDGQAIATARLAGLLEDDFDVSCHDVSAPEDDGLLIRRRRLSDARHFARVLLELRRSLSDRPSATVLWGSITPTLLGHFRDVATVVPGLGSRPVVGVVHSGNFDSLFRRRATAWTGRALVRRLRALVFLSEGLAERAAPFVPAEKRWVVPNTVDAAAVPTPAALEAARAGRLARSGLHLLFLSGMIPSKGYGDVLGALALLRGRGVDATARFVGRWPSPGAEAAFRARVAALGLGAHADVVGGVGRAEVQGLLLEADAFVLPTAYPVEAQPLTVIEALAAGTPVVVTRHASLPEMVTGPEGRFVAAGAPGEVADAVAGLADPGAWAAASRAARARFETAFSPDVVGRRWRDVLAQLDESP